MNLPNCLETGVVGKYSGVVGNYSNTRGFVLELLTAAALHPETVDVARIALAVVRLEPFDRRRQAQALCGQWQQPRRNGPSRRMPRPTCPGPPHPSLLT